MTSDQHSEIARNIKREFLQFHQDIESRMSRGFLKLEDELQSSKDKILERVDRLLSQQDSFAKDSHHELLLGQQDVMTSLSRLSCNISDAHYERKDEVAQKMKELLNEHKNTTQILAHLFKGHSRAQSAQIQQLVSFCCRWMMSPYVCRHVLSKTLQIMLPLRKGPKTKTRLFISRQSSILE